MHINFNFLNQSCRIQSISPYTFRHGVEQSNRVSGHDYEFRFLISFYLIVQIPHMINYLFVQIKILCNYFTQNVNTCMVGI